MNSNVATDANQLVMSTMKKIALRHDLVCLLHEKPFAGVNGSGKHNNWSMSTNEGQNLLEPGDDPHQNLQFLLFLMAVIKAVDTYSLLLRTSAANSGNDHRLGANEAPPAIISIFLGEQLADILEQIEKGELKASKKSGELELGAQSLPKLPKDNTDRNRTSPFAFTGNKFEFRMVGSTASTSGPNFVINSIVADVLSEFADRLEKASDLTKEVNTILAETVKEHKKIIFNGDNYSDDWVKEAESRGLPNVKSMAEALPVIVEKETIDLFKRQKVLTEKELQARFNILSEQYAKQINIEALTAINIVKKQIIPVVAKYIGQLAEALGQIKASVSDANTSTQESLIKKASTLLAEAQSAVDELEEKREKAEGLEDEPHKMAMSYRMDVFPVMTKLRESVDQLEMLVDARDWPLPSYAEMLLMS
jgi:glutamine synthetase